MTDGADQLRVALVALGLPPEEADLAVAQDRVALALVWRAAAGEAALGVDEAAARSGVDPAVVRAFNAAVGLDEDHPFTTGELTGLAALPGLLEHVPLDVVLATVRSGTPALARIALGNLEVVRDQVVAPLREAGADEITVALALAEVTRTLLDPAAELVALGYRRVLAGQLGSELVAAATRSAKPPRVVLAAGFVDVVGYTSLAARIDPAGLDEVLTAFEARCLDVAARTPSLQLVKFVGDAAFFVAPEAVTLAGALLALVEEGEGEGPLAGSPVHAGMAAGPVLVRAGDYFGAAVNVAARLTDRARGGALLADEALAGELAEEFALRRTPPMHLRGLGVRRPLRVRGRVA